jgi:hypothetical protein
MSRSDLPRTKRGLGDLRGRVLELLDLHDRVTWVDHLEVRHGVDAGGDVVAGDHVLGRDVEGDTAKVDAHELIDDGDQQDEPRALLPD